MLNQGMTEQYILRAAQSHFARRHDHVSGINTAAAAAARQTEIRQAVAEILGPFPERAPLQHKIVKTLQREGYSVEVTTYQSLPDVVTTANLYLPEDAGQPVPAVACFTGDALDGKVQAEYQRLGQLLARRGIAALIFDSAGNGERLEFYDSSLRHSWVGKAVVNEQAHLGNLLVLTGYNLNAWMLWDAMRGLDLLVERGIADPKKLGATGCGAGAALTRLLCCIEPRLAAAVSVSDPVELEGLGGAEIEQNLFDGVPRGISPLDLLVPFAPRALLLASSAADKAGERMRRNLDELKRWYGLLGSAANIDLFEGDTQPGYSKPIRGRAVEHFARAFGLPESRVREPETPPEKAGVLHCTETGQTLNSLNMRTLFSVHKELVTALPPSVAVPKDAAGVARVQDEIRQRVLPFLRLPESAVPVTASVESHSHDWGFMVEKGRLEIERELYLPYSFYTLPQNADSPGTSTVAPTVLALHERGIAGISSEGEWMTGLAACGVHVLAIDVCGIGETRLQRKDDETAAYDALLNGDESQWARRALNAGLSLFGLRVFSALRALVYMRSRWDIDRNNLSIMGIGRGALWGLFAAALDRDVKNVAMLRGLSTYKSLIERHRHNHHFSMYLPGCLRAFDLPHVAACIAPRRLSIINAVNPRKERCEAAEVERDYALATALYKGVNAAANLRIVNTDSAPETFLAVKAVITHSREA